ncbi:MAG: hypothetical protein M3Z24_09810 [Chloroflexota bacterium]|nr:hypothetical protein [Chloroflexota bacterium]
MSKLLDMFKRAQRAQGVAGMGFLGKNRTENKPRAAALIVEYSTIDAGSAEAAIKAGADGLLFPWDGADTASLDTLKKGIEAAKGSKENVVCGLHMSHNWDTIERENLEELKEVGVNYIVLPLQAPARLLATHVKDLDMVVTVPMREGDMYPIFIRNLTAFDTITAIRLDFDLVKDMGSMSIEDVIQYRAVREAVRFPAIINIPGDVSEDDAFTLSTLGVQALVLEASNNEETTKTQIKHVSELLEKVYETQKDDSASMGMQ